MTSSGWIMIFFDTFPSDIHQYPYVFATLQVQRNMNYSLVPIHGTHPPISQWDGGGGPVIMKRPSVLSGTGSEIGRVVWYDFQGYLASA